MLCHPTPTIFARNRQVVVRRSEKPKYRYTRHPNSYIKRVIDSILKKNVHSNLHSEFLLVKRYACLASCRVWNLGAGKEIIGLVKD